jgi:hypothetical protein
MWDVIATPVYDEWFAALPDEVAKAVSKRVDYIRAEGPFLKRPHADTLDGSKHANMKELRVDEAGQVIRIAFAFDPTRQAILLVAGSKQGVEEKRFYAELIRRADALYDTHLASLSE